MIESLTLLFLLITILFIATRVKMRNNYYRNQVEPMTSPLTEALGQLLAIAGGIYLSLVMLASFLGLESIDKIYCGGLQLDPLAVVAFVLALVQPFFIHLFRKITH